LFDNTTLSWTLPVTVILLIIVCNVKVSSRISCDNCVEIDEKIKNSLKLYITPRNNDRGTVDSATSQVFYLPNTADIG
jgi:hypothetical protein